jgi:ABC-type glycerol-3-phosphate transport system substrate-binding protein
VAVRRVALVGVVAALIAAGCGGQSTYSADKSRACLKSANAQVGGPLDFVATTATGGAFVAKLSDNWVTVAFGAKEPDAADIAIAYQRFASQNVRANIGDVLERYRNAVLLWHEHPNNADLALIIGCLK